MTLPLTGYVTGLLAVAIEALIGSRYFSTASLFAVMPVTVVVYVVFAIVGGIVAERLDLP